MARGSSGRARYVVGAGVSDGRWGGIAVWEQGPSGLPLRPRRRPSLARPLGRRGR